MSPPRPERACAAVVFDIRGHITRADIPTICDHVRASVQRGVTDVVFDVGGLHQPDAVTADALAQLQVTVRRRGGRIQLRRASCELQDLLTFMGLAEALPVWWDLPVEVGGQSEQREELGGVQEEADPGDRPT